MAKFDPFAKYPGGVSAYDQEVARQREMKPHADRICQQYQRGLLTVDDMILALAELDENTR